MPQNDTLRKASFAEQENNVVEETIITVILAENIAISVVEVGV